MKITDKELLDAIWKNQLRILSKNVLDNYVCGEIGLCGDREVDYQHSSSEHRITRACVTKKISFKQLKEKSQYRGKLQIIHL